MELWHITITTPGRIPFFANEAEKRAALRRLVKVSGSRLVSFSLVDEHIHLVVFGTRQEASHLAQAVSLSLGSLAAMRLIPAHIKHVEDRTHMNSLVEYHLKQAAHHGLKGHPALLTGSPFCDFIGARMINGARLRVEIGLPRIDVRTCFRVVGLENLVLRPIENDRIHVLGACRLRDAVTAALCESPDLEAHTAQQVVARSVVAQMAQQSGIPAHDVSAALEIAAGSVRRLRSRPTFEDVERAVRLRLALEVAVSSDTP